MKAVIFDFDGVLFDTEMKKFEDLRKILLGYNLQLHDSDFNAFLGKKTEYYVRFRFGALNDNEVRQIVFKRGEEKQRHIERNAMVPGLRELLIYLKKRKIKLVVCSGSRTGFMRSLMRMHSIESYFDVIIGGEEFGSSKPDPECYNLATGKLGLPLTDILVIEDSPAGIVAAKKAGLRVFAIKTYLNEEALVDANACFKNHRDLLAYFSENRDIQ